MKDRPLIQILACRLDWINYLCCALQAFWLKSNECETAVFWHDGVSLCWLYSICFFISCMLFEPIAERVVAKKEKREKKLVALLRVPHYTIIGKTMILLL